MAPLTITGTMVSAVIEDPDVSELRRRIIWPREGVPGTVRNGPLPPGEVWSQKYGEPGDIVDVGELLSSDRDGDCSGDGDGETAIRMDW
jgi:hypothetical protein